ncbi:MAG: hypothetical protein LKM44_01390 [Wolbachia endosymbiont of Meromenopon meropis]|nr:hypothetical protein [Wolbachia endosymbiont of Meromenopon meropis]
MKQFTYTGTVVASLLALCSFSSFATNFSDENTKKQENAVISGKMEAMKASNKRLREKMNKLCNTDVKKKTEDFSEENFNKNEELKPIENKKKEEIELANAKKAKTLNAENLHVEGSKTRNSKTQMAKAQTKSVGKGIQERDVTSSAISVGDINVIDNDWAANCLRITFGGVIDVQGYAKIVSNSGKYKFYNVMPGKSKSYYGNIENERSITNPIFPHMIGNVGDYSDDMGMISDAMLHLRAEKKNEDLGFLYGADMQFHVSATKGGSRILQGINAARGSGAHVFLNSKYGNLKLGYQFGPEVLMRLDATRIATVDGAADSDWFRKVNVEGIDATFPFYVTPRLYTESFSSASEKFSFRMSEEYKKNALITLPFRIAYYSPDYMGARFGLSYSPRYENDLFLFKENDNVIRHVGPNYAHMMSVGASYQYDSHRNDIKVKTSIVGEAGKMKEPDKSKHFYKEFVEYDNLIGVNFGISADYKINEDQSMRFAASLAYLAQSGQPKGIKKLNDISEYVKVTSDGTNDDDSKRLKILEDRFVGDDKSTLYWTAGTGYQYDTFYTSLTYFGSTMAGGNQLHDVALGVQYDLSHACSKSKFIPYATLHYFTTDEMQTHNYKFTKGSDANLTSSSNNKGALFLTGVKFSF